MLAVSHSRAEGRHLFEATQQIKYAQCWEDADVLLAALKVNDGDTCLSIASGGENTLSLLVANPSRVVAIDMNPAQLACLELKMAGFRCLTHCELLILIGSVSCPKQYSHLFLASPGDRRPADTQEALRADGKNSFNAAACRLVLYRRCRKYLSEEARQFWDSNKPILQRGIGHGGRFENYFKIFRETVLPVVHNKKTVGELLAVKTLEQQQQFYEKRWNTLPWQLMFRVFFSRKVMSSLGRSAYQFKQVDQPVASRILERTAFALQHIPTATNPYLRWILTGEHGNCLPHALRRENFEAIKRNIDRIELRRCSLESALCSAEVQYDRFNLSDIFEYMSAVEYERHLRLICDSASFGARIVYWNMLASRHSCAVQGDLLRSLDQVSLDLFRRDNAFFYSDLVIEEVSKCSAMCAQSS